MSFGTDYEIERIDDVGDKWRNVRIFRRTYSAGARVAWLWLFLTGNGPKVATDGIQLLGGSYEDGGGEAPLHGSVVTTASFALFEGRRERHLRRFEWRALYLDGVVPVTRRKARRRWSCLETPPRRRSRSRRYRCPQALSSHGGSADTSATGGSRRQGGAESRSRSNSERGRPAEPLVPARSDSRSARQRTSRAASGDRPFQKLSVSRRAVKTCNSPGGFQSSTT